VATNEAGTDQQAFTLEVLIPSKVSAASTPAQSAVPQGGNSTLKCTARGYPQPQIHWSMEKTPGSEVNNALRKYILYILEGLTFGPPGTYIYIYYLIGDRQPHRTYSSQVKRPKAQRI
jgi:hypothetical protein